MPNGTQYRDKNPEAAISNGSSDESKCCTVTEMCQQVFYNIIVSEKFTLLCKLLLENFQGIKAESLFCMHTIDSKMKEGVYEHSPELFLMDIQQVLMALQSHRQAVSLFKHWVLASLLTQLAPPCGLFTQNFLSFFLLSKKSYLFTFIWKIMMNAWFLQVLQFPGILLVFAISMY